MPRALRFLLVLFVLAPRLLAAQERGAVALGELVDGLGVTTRVLVIGAHPDDEDTRLIAWLARGQHVETAYLSLTRGDGGQNLIGNELGEALGAIRTEELLAARRIDGAHQYFTRAYDFGFSKTAEETFTHWPHDSVLGDVVTVVRAFRPHVIITIWSGTPADGHGQHQAAGILAREAYAASGDTVRFPSARFGAPWAASKLYRAAGYRREGATLSFNVGAYDPLLGRSYAEIAGESRSQHRSQAMGTRQPKGAMLDYVQRLDTRVAAPADPARERSLFDGIDTTWQRVRGELTSADNRAMIDSIARAVAEAQRTLDLRHPEAVVPPLAGILRSLDRMCFTTPAENDERCEGHHVEHSPDAIRTIADLVPRASAALLTAAGVAIEGTAARPSLAIRPVGGARANSGGAAGAALDTIGLDVAVYNRGRDTIEVTEVIADLASETGANGTVPLSPQGMVAPDSAARGHRAIPGWVPPGEAIPVTQPWWLAAPRHGDLFGVPIDEQAEDQRMGAELAVFLRIHAPGVPVQPVAVAVPVLYRFVDPAQGEVSQPLQIEPAVSITLDRAVEYVPANTLVDRELRVELRSGTTAPSDVVVRLELPAGLRADSASRTVVLPAYGAVRAVTFRLRGKLAPGQHTIAAVAESGGERFTRGYLPIEYSHIRPQRIYRDATLTLEAVDVKLPAGLTVAYVPGVGDNVAPALRALGVPLTVLDPAQLATVSLDRFSTVVIGPRAYEASPELVAYNNRLLDYVRRGGRLVVQYGQYEMARPGIMPYPVTLARPADRVTDENAPVQVLDAASPLLHRPNAIGQGDFAGWVQERSLYMPHTFDARYAPVLAMHDPGEAADSAAILVAGYGRGTYVYTTLSFFRQLPAGNPGAARLFVNLLAAEPPAGGRAAAKAGK